MREQCDFHVPSQQQPANVARHHKLFELPLVGFPPVVRTLWFRHVHVCLIAVQHASY
ncbi:hypothetical protein SCLCIDRAFT_1211816 [Scleroderma citrinum Foug A]|uniref:Uncharacterized protein n=1 Tax=Scleroderma citrinum Foug A TaxID=1036808 RepID=A0A0C2ZWH4_9AGAM|nr:hypothetical protein SCLCIDRAFT_1211816 [Scleroderma citrinum Foug A]